MLADFLDGANKKGGLSQIIETACLLISSMGPIKKEGYQDTPKSHIRVTSVIIGGTRARASAIDESLAASQCRRVFALA